MQRLQILVSSTDGRAISQQELDYAKSNQHSADAAVRERQANLELLIKGARKEDREATRAQYEVTKANLDLINYNLTQAELRSPVNAVVRARLQEVGDMTTAQKAVYTLALTNPKWIRVYVNEHDLSSIKMGGTTKSFVMLIRISLLMEKLAIYLQWLSSHLKQYRQKRLEQHLFTKFECM